VAIPFAKDVVPDPADASGGGLPRTADGLGRSERLRRRADPCGPGLEQRRPVVDREGIDRIAALLGRLSQWSPVAGGQR